MMYKLLIVDDEEAIREGLCNIVNWKSLGYEVVQAVEDGQDAVEYIKKYPVDVILTDIKMTFMSGLELAKYVSENKYDVKVVIISGYKEFEFARQALNYNVKYYLLKPTRLDELKKVFSELRDEMELEYAEKEKLKTEKQQHQELIFLTQEQFFTDLILGSIRNKENVDKRIKCIGLNFNPSESKICILSLCSVNSGSDYREEIVGKDTLYSTLRNYIGRDIGHIRYFTVFNSTQHVQIVAVTSSYVEDEDLKKIALSTINKISMKIKAILGISMEIEIERIFNSMYEAAAHYEPLKPSSFSFNYKLEEVVDPCDLSMITKQKKLFFSHIYSDNSKMAQCLFENFIDELKYMDKKVMHNFCIDLFANLKSGLSELGIDVSNNLFDYELILKLYDINEIKLWGCFTLENISRQVKKHKDISEKNVIQKAKEYINDNFDKDIGLDEVAEHVFLSSIYFSRIFKQQTGENFVEYLMKTRMRKAMEFLQEPRQKIYEVSIRVGYKNTKYFYKLFKEFTGLTPAEYRGNVMKEG